MMRIAVVSDSHGDRAALQSLAQRLDNVEKIIHLGDCVPDGELLSAMTGKQVLGVKGNCDFSRNAPEERLETLGGAKLLICHGHRYQVKSGRGVVWPDAFDQSGLPEPGTERGGPVYDLGIPGQWHRAGGLYPVKGLTNEVDRRILIVA